MSREDFWSRRKARVEAEEQAERQRAAALEEARAQAARDAEQEEKTDEELLAELNLPLPETLAPGQDVSAFMAKAVPQRLRQRALRQLWRVNPALANLDNLLEYGEDYTDAATVIENLQTAYQVGKGMLRHVEKMAAEAEAEAEAARRTELAGGTEGEDIADETRALASETETARDTEGETDETAEPAEAQDAAEAAPQAGAGAGAGAEVDIAARNEGAQPPRARRRMRFAHHQE